MFPFGVKQFLAIGIRKIDYRYDPDPHYQIETTPSWPQFFWIRIVAFVENLLDPGYLKKKGKLVPEVKTCS